jgi:DNA adenine methylase
MGTGGVIEADIIQTPALNRPKRPLLRYHGGKWRLAPWIISHLPPHKVYVDPYGGAGSVLFQKPRSYGEVYNDLDDRIVRIFRLLRDPVLSARLIEQLRLTPFAKTEFVAAYEPCEDEVEYARRMIIRSFMGFGSDSTAGHYRTGFRGNVTRSGSTPAMDWSRYPQALRALIERVEAVTIYNMPAIDLMKIYDKPDVLFYVDPPYHPDTRSTGNRRRAGPGSKPWQVYAHELQAEDHEELLLYLSRVDAMVALSGYPHPLYDDLLNGWKRIERKAHADGAKPRTEVLWLNPMAAAAANSPSML